MNISDCIPLPGRARRHAAPHWHQGPRHWRRSLLRWRQGLDALGVPVWPGILASVAFIGLLLAFHQVVSGAVQQGESRHRAQAAHADATWRCNALRGPGASQACLAQLGTAQAAAEGAAMLRAPSPTLALQSIR